MASILAMESVSIASALSTALTIYPCQIWVHQRRLPTSYSSEEGVAAAWHSGQFTPCGYLSTLRYTLYFSRLRTRNLPIVGWLLVRRATSSATDSRLLTSSTYNLTYILTYLLMTSYKKHSTPRFLQQHENAVLTDLFVSNTKLSRDRYLKWITSPCWQTD